VTTGPDDIGGGGSVTGPGVSRGEPQTGSLGLTGDVPGVLLTGVGGHPDELGAGDVGTCVDGRAGVVETRVHAVVGPGVGRGGSVSPGAGPGFTGGGFDPAAGRGVG
jgi:hypothetical protein